MLTLQMKPLTVVDVQQRLGGISRTRVLQLDSVLRPRRTETGTRLYRADAIERFAAIRRERSRP